MAMGFTSNSYALRPRTVAVAQEQATRAAGRKIHLFRAYPFVSREDLAQEAMCGILRANYDLSKAAFASFAYTVAKRRILDYHRACGARPLTAGLGDREVRGSAAVPSLDVAAAAMDRPMAGARGRPWKEPLDVRLAMMRRREAGESWGSIAGRFNVDRHHVRQIVEGLKRKLEKRCGINRGEIEGQKRHRRRRRRRERING